MPVDRAQRSVPSVVSFVAAMSIVMAFGVEAMLPAFDDIDEQFGFGDRGLSISLTVTALLVGMGVGTLAWGPVSDRVGRRPVLLAGFVIYALGAVGTAVAPDLELLLLARFVWGFGAAAPGSIRFAVARDIYEGDRMARVVTIATAVFLIGPLLMPIVGELILMVGSWELIAYAAVLLALLGAVWALRFGETLLPQNRRPLRVRVLAEAMAEVLRARQAVGAIVAATLYFAAFFVWLGSAQPILGDLFGRDDQFVWFFGVAGLVMAGNLLVTDRLIGAIGARDVAVRAGFSFVAVCLVGLVATLVVGGLSLWPWFIWVVASNALGAVMSPVCSALALDPLGEIAGFASSILNFSVLVPGALLAAIVDAAIDDSVTPMIVGSTVFGVLGLIVLLATLPAASGPTALARATESGFSSSTTGSTGG